ncbi:helix-turn-helix domain-containing protein [Pedobacter heparinus]
MPTKFIVYELGFEYPLYFCRFFKKMTGMRPKEWKRGAAPRPLDILF